MRGRAAFARVATAVAIVAISNECGRAQRTPTYNVSSNARSGGDDAYSDHRASLMLQKIPVIAGARQAYHWRQSIPVAESDVEDVMEHKTLEQIRDVADILPERPGRRLSRRQRLERWADILEREGGRRLATLREIEYAPPEDRDDMRADDSPLTVAFADPRLRAEGLAGDTVGDAAVFFGMSPMQLHGILCVCHHGSTIAADAAARRIRAAIAQQQAYAQAAFAGAAAAASIMIGALLL